MLPRAHIPAPGDVLCQTYRSLSMGLASLDMCSRVQPSRAADAGSGAQRRVASEADVRVSEKQKGLNQSARHNEQKMVPR
ncbi:hypothetical protein NDU88_005615 [Pleurodeles waltl]|uniref:Uncharacterized protein n=1 Tax=Pleurodeles waltl TaxID=8319 RepID=A0AAV7TBU2_PLEWA|nr:hypothetical protein NDU88_005615 [Pleurodeles waltl]